MKRKKLRTILRRKNLSKEGQDILPKKNWIADYKEIQKAGHRDRAVKWVLRVLTFALLYTCA